MLRLPIKNIQSRVGYCSYLDQAYVPHKVENLSKVTNYFKPPLKDVNPFKLVLPPPNITGTLHLGHALTATIQDVLVRWKRMQGVETVWIPGMDHAGIATQMIVEKLLWKENQQTRHTLGRELFLEKVHKWRSEKTSTIKSQLDKMNILLDWEKEIFTLDKQRSKAVQEAFIQLFDSGLIYRADALVNWSCILKSAISDIEVEQLSINSSTKISIPGYDKPVEFGILTKFAYLVDGTDQEIVVATTRTETMLGDVAVAVHPEDPRYASYIGKSTIWNSYAIMDIERTPSHDLKCSICKNYLNIAPVLTSDDGTVTKCGRCQYKGPTLNNRNTLYESIGSKLRFPCMNKECKDRMAWNDVQRHERSCAYRKISCPFWNCRDKNISFVISNDISHFESCHPGSMHYGPITLNFKVITHHQSFIKLLIIEEVPFLMFIHCLKFGEAAVLIGVFSCTSKQHDYEIKIRSDTDSNRFTLFKEKVQLYDEHQHCLYCLQNICFLEYHKFSKKHPDNQQQRYTPYSTIDVAAAKSLLQTENLLFDISVSERRDEENGSIISRNSD